MVQQSIKRKLVEIIGLLKQMGPIFSKEADKKVGLFKDKRFIARGQAEH